MVPKRQNVNMRCYTCYEITSIPIDKWSLKQLKTDPRKNNLRYPKYGLDNLLATGAVSSSRCLSAYQSS